MKGRIPAVFLVLLLVAPATVQAQYTCSTNADNTLTITGYSGPEVSSLNIPANIDGLPVTAIGDGAFWDQGYLTSATIPGGVTSIGGAAFQDCTGLTNITIPDGVTDIGDYAFAYCGSLISVVIPGNVTGLGVESFFDCTSLTSLTIPGSVSYIGVSAFEGCGGLTNLTIANGVESIENAAFEGCTNLTSVVIPESVNSIGTLVFLSCTRLTAVTVDASNSYYSSVNGVLFDKDQTTLVEYPCGVGGSYIVPSSVNSIAANAFQYCTRLTGVTIPGSVTEIGFRAFYICSSLTNVTMANGVATIGPAAFGGCQGLFSVTIPGSVTSIGADAFSACIAMTSIFFKGNAPIADVTMFDFDYGLVLYYLPGTTGWEEFFLNTGLSGVLWNPSMQASDPNFGVRNNHFGFDITGTSNIPIKVESCTNLTGAIWTPLQTLTLTNGSFYFSDPQWTNYSGRYYRISSP